MSGPRIEWMIGPELQAMVEPLLARWLWALPGWVRVVKVRAEDRGSSNYASSLSQVEYRDYTLNLGPLWVAQSSTERERTIAHELAHAILAPIVEMGWKMKNALPEGAFREFADATWSDAFEASTTDMADALLAAPRRVTPAL